MSEADKMREDLEKHIATAEASIRKALQEFHDATGLVPVSFEFGMVDTTTVGERAAGVRRCVVGEHKLTAAT